MRSTQLFLGAAALLLAACSADLALPDGARITCDADGSCPEGRVCNNAGECVPVGELDTTPPDLVSATVTPAAGKAGTRFEVVLQITEPLPSPPTVTLALPVPAQLPCTGGPDSFTCSYTADGTENEHRGGPIPVDVLLLDADGNPNQRRAAASLQLDFFGPRVLLSSAAPPKAGLGVEVQLFFSLDEPLQGPALLHVSPPLPGQGPAGFELLPLPGSLDVDFRFDHLVTVEDAAGELSFELSATDRVGNEVTALPLGTVTLDPVPPVLSGASVEPPFAKDGSEVLARFTVSKPLAEEPDVRLGDEQLSCALDGTGYLCTTTVSATSGGAPVAPGRRQVTVQGRDEAGNPIFEGIGVVELDFVAPALIDPRITPHDVHPGQLVLAVLAADEPLGPAPILSATGSAAPAFVPVPGTVDRFTWTVPAGAPEGLDQLSVILEDRAGNRSMPLPAGELVVDATSPVVGGLQVSPRQIDEDGTVTVTFSLDADPEPGGSLDVSVGGRPVDGCDRSLSPATIICSRAMRGDELQPGAEALQGVAVRAIDAAGNIGAAIETVLFDFKPPALVAASPPELEPRQGALVPAVSEVGDGTTIRLAFTLDEPVQVGAATPDGITVVAGAAPGLAFACTSTSGTSFRCTHTFADTGQPGGQLPITVTATDLAGNPATIVLPDGFIVDTDPPRDLDVSAQDQLALRRRPYGTDGSAGIPDTSLDVAPGALEAGATLIVRDGATGAELGRGIEPVGTLDLGTSDRIAVTVEQVDRAGNGSLPVAVRDGSWTASLGYKIRGSLFENRTTLGKGEQLPPFDGQQWTEPAQQELDLLERLGGPASLAPAQGWVERAPTPPLASGPLSFVHAATWDSLRQRELVFTVQANPSRTAEWDSVTERWSELVFVGHFNSRYDTSVAYDRLRDRVVLYGGTGSRFGVPLGDSWEWDPGARTWTELTPAASPPPLRLHTLVYDPLRGRVLLSGGVDELGVPNRDLWEFDGSSWSMVPGGRGPPARTGGALAEDPLTGTVLLFGGRDESGSFLGDTWEWDGAAEVWQDRTSLFFASPAARADAVMSPDPSRGTVVLHGGDNGRAATDSWEWDGSRRSWTERSSSGGPPSTIGAGLFPDALHRRLRLITAGNDPDSWEWDGEAARWYHRPLPTGLFPPLRTYAVGAHDRARDSVVLFGGFRILGGSFLGDTWEYSAGVWVDRTDPATSPSPRYNHAIAYDEDRGVVVLFGGFGTSLSELGDTWEWDGSVGAWTERFPASAPAARSGAAMAFDPVRRTVLLFGGGDGAGMVSDLWEWNGAAGSWTDLTAQAGVGPSARTNTTLAVDRDRGRVLLFGGKVGAGVDAAFWEWDGSVPRWIDHTLPGAPPPRYAAGLTYDEDRRLVLLHGGYSTDFLRDTWEWDEATGLWTDRTVPGAPQGQAPLLFDALRGVAVMQAIDPLAPNAGRTFEWNGRGTGRATARWDVPWTVAGVSAQEIVRVTGTVTAGGSGRDRSFPAQPVGGTELLGWDTRAGAFELLATSPDLSSPLFFEERDPARLALLLGLPGQRLSLVVQPASPSGPGPAFGALDLDYLELTLGYRRP